MVVVVGRYYEMDVIYYLFRVMAKRLLQWNSFRNGF